MINLNELKQKLQEGVVTVEFTKVNGELRTMPCTLNEVFIPQEQAPKGTGKRHSEDTLSVWCTDKSAWRSFRVDSVISFTPSLI